MTVSTSYKIYSSILHLRGKATIPQPLVNGGNALAFNGEIYEYSPSYSLELQNCSDSLFLMARLDECGGNQDKVLTVLSMIKGLLACVSRKVN